VHDIAPPHPRYAQLTHTPIDGAAEVPAHAGDADDRHHPGGIGALSGAGVARCGAEQDRNRSLSSPAPFLQAIDPDLAFSTYHLRSPMRDGEARCGGGRPRAGRRLRRAARAEVLAMMRGADTIVIFKNRQVRVSGGHEGTEDPRGGAGVYQDNVRSLGAEPCRFPGNRDGRGARRAERLDGIITSPAAGGRTSRTRPEREPRSGAAVLHVLPDRGKRGSMRCPLASRKRSPIRARFRDREWSEMQADDARLVQSSFARSYVWQSYPGESIASVAGRGTEGVTRGFGGCASG